MLALMVARAAATGRACTRRLPRVPGWAKLLWTSTALLLVLGVLSWRGGHPPADEYAAQSDCERFVRRHVGPAVAVQFLPPAAGNARADADGGWAVDGALQLTAAPSALPARPAPAQRSAYHCSLRYEHGGVRLAALELDAGAAHQPSRLQEQR